MIEIVVVLGLLLALGAWLVGMYNGLVRLRNIVRNAWSQIDVQLKRRHDLIPNLVETVKGYAEHEKTTLQNVTEALSPEWTPVPSTLTSLEIERWDGRLMGSRSSGKSAT